MPASEIVRRAWVRVLEYAEAFLPSGKIKGSTDRWRAPGDDMIKINVDGAFTPGDSFTGWGVVVRDGAGYIVAAHAGRQDHV